MDEGRGRSDLEEGLQVLLTGQGDLATPKEVEGHTTPGGDEERRPYSTIVGVPRQSLVRTPGNVCNILEAKGEVLVAGDVQQCANLPINHSLQLDGRFSDDADGKGR